MHQVWGGLFFRYHFLIVVRMLGPCIPRTLQYKAQVINIQYLLQCSFNTNSPTIPPSSFTKYHFMASAYNVICFYSTPTLHHSSVDLYTNILIALCSAKERCDTCQFHTYPLRAAPLASWPLASCSCSCEEAAAAVVEETTARGVDAVAVVEPPALTVWAEGATTDSQIKQTG